MFKGIKGVIIFTVITFAVSLGYGLYVYNIYPPVAENETFWGEVGEAFGEAGLWGLVFIYARTLMKLLLGKGRIAQRLLPDYSPQLSIPLFDTALGLLNKTHVFVGIATLAVIFLHISMMGVPMDILFFPAVLALLVWQGLFGMFLSWKFSPKELKKFAYLVHAQFFTGIMIGIFAWFGHLLIDD